MYAVVVPRLWTETVDAHRREVREAILDSAAELVAEHGLLSVTMARIAQQAGIGRATLYKYFPDVEAILLAWHRRQVAGHLAHLTEVRDRAGDRAGGARQRLEAVLAGYARIRSHTASHHRHRHHEAELAAFLHRDEQLAGATQQLRDMVKDLLTDAVRAGEVRDDVPPDELAAYCLHALASACDLPSEAAVHRLVTVTLAGLRGAG